MKFKQIQKDNNIKQNEDTCVINNKGERIGLLFLHAKNSKHLHRNHLHGLILVLSLLRTCLISLRGVKAKREGQSGKNLKSCLERRRNGRVF
jgi:hypothetical protein